MDFILRSQADAVIRMDQWEERFQAKMDLIDDRFERIDDKFERIQDELQKAVAAIQETAKLSGAAMKESRRATSATRKQTKQIKTLEKSTRFVSRRSDNMRDLMKIAMRLLAHQSKRVDELEKGAR